jgi:PAS domain S-box-containing protein
MFLSFLRFFKKLWWLLTEPFERLPKAEDRRRARISTIFLLLSFLAVGVGQIAAGDTPFAALVILFLSYFVSRTRWYKFATTALLITLTFPSFLAVLNVQEPNSNRIVMIFVWIILPLILSGLLNSVRTTIIYSSLVILVLAILPFIRRELDFRIMGATMGFYSMAVLFIIIAMIQRDEFERDRQVELIESRNRLGEEALQRKKFAEQAQRRADQLALLYEVGHAISNLQVLDEILEVIFDQVKRVIPFDVFYIALYDKKTNLVSLPFLFDNGRMWHEQSRPLSETSFVAKVVQTGQPFLMDLSDEEFEEAKKTSRRVGDHSRTAPSGLMSPLQIGSRVIGMISAQSYARHAYNGDHLATLTALAQQVTIAIENARLFEQTTKRAQRLAILNDIGRETSTLADLSTLMKNVYQQVRNVLSADLFFIGLYDAGKNLLSFPIMYDEGQRWEQYPILVTDDTFSGKTIQTQTSFIINEWSASTKEDESPPTTVGNEAKITKSMMFAPILFGRETIGVISVQSYRANAFNEEDLNLLSGIANQVAIAIQNTRHLEETRKNAGYLSILNELGRVVAELRDLPDLLEVIYPQVKKHLSVDAFFVDLYDPESNLVTHPITYDDGRRYTSKSEELQPNLFLHQFLNGSPAILILRTEMELDQPLNKGGMFGDKTRKSASLIAAPIKVGDQVIGAISVQSYSLNAYTEDDLTLLVGIGNQVGIAVQNARLLEEAKKNAGYLETLNELGRVVSELRNLPDLLEVIYEQVKLHLSVDAFFVGLYHPEKKLVSYPIMYDEGVRYHPSPDELTTHSFLYNLLHGGKAARILRTREEIEAVPTDKGMLGNEAKKSASLLIAPLKIGEQTIGVISVQSYTLDAYTEDHLKLLVGIGNQVGVAIQNAHLVEEIKQSAKHLSILNDVGQAVSKIMDLPDLLEVIYEQGRKSISLDAFFVGLYHPETNEISFPLTFDSGKRFDSQPGQVSESSFLGRFLKGEKSILINRTEEELVSGITRQQRMGEENKLSASIIAAPMFSRDRVIGMISAQSYTLNAYNESDLKLLEGIASQVAIAIENSRLYTSAQQELKERERVEMELQKERDFAVQVMNTLGQGVSVSMLDGVYEYVNLAYAHMLGYNPDDMIGEPSEHFAIPNEDEKHSEHRKYLERGETTTYETRLKHKDGHTIHVLVTGVPRYLDGRIIGSIAAITDLSERRRAEIERENMLAEMERKNAELERFTYTVSHDLKSPLVTIGGFLGFLEADIKSRDYDRIHRSLGRIREATKKMQRLLEELLELSRIGRIANPSQDVPFGELVRETLELVEGQLREKQVEVRVDAEFPVVYVDRVRVLEVIQNLVTNAIKFMGTQEHPQIHIGMESRDDECTFFVRDNGIGIAPEYHERIFGLFNKLDPFTEGTGIGLALIKRIIEVHGGKIWVESEPGKGATFFFTLANIKQQETL